MSSSWLVGSSLQRTTQSYEHQSKRPRASKMMSVKYFKCCEKEGDQRYHCPPREIGVTKKKEEKNKHLIVECRPSTSTLVWCLNWVSGPAGSGLSSGSWMVFCPFLVHCSWRSTGIRGSIVWWRLLRLFKVLQVHELLSICKNGPWDFVLVPYLFKKLPVSVPVLEKALSNYGFDGHKNVYEYFRW